MIEKIDYSLSKISSTNSEINTTFPEFQSNATNFGIPDILLPTFYKYAFPGGPRSQWIVYPTTSYGDIDSFTSIKVAFKEPVNLGYLTLEGYPLHICYLKRYINSLVDPASTIEASGAPLPLEGDSTYSPFNRLYIGKVLGFELGIHYMDFYAPTYYPKFSFDYGEITLPPKYFGIEKFDKKVTFRNLTYTDSQQKQLLAAITGDYWLTGENHYSTYYSEMMVSLEAKRQLSASYFVVNASVPQDAGFTLKLYNGATEVGSAAYTGPAEPNEEVQVAATVPVYFDKYVITVTGTGAFTPRLLLLKE